MTSIANGELGLSVRAKLNDALAKTDKLATTATGIDVTGGLNTTGSVGIGTSSPRTLVELSSSTPILMSTNTSGATNEKTFGLYNGGGQFKIRSYDDAFTGGRDAIVVSKLGAGNSIDYISMHTGAGTERLRITSTGSVGIGTSSPSALLDVVSASNPSMKVRSNGGTVGNYADITLQTFNTFSGSGQAFVRGVSSASGNSNTDLLFGTNDSGFGAPVERLRIDASGNLGLGVVPSAWGDGKAVEVGFNGNSLWSYSQTDSYLTNNAKFSDAWRYNSTAAASSYRQSTGNHYWYTAPSGTAGSPITFSQAMTLDASGKLSVGTTGAFGVLNLKEGAVSLEVNTDSTSANLLAYNRGSSAYATLGLRAGDVRFLISDTERARIDASGNLLVGTTTTASTVIGVKVLPSGRFTLVTADSGTQYPVQFGREITGVVGTITTTASATSYNTSSDYRLKDDIQPVANAADRLLQLKPINFAWKVDGSRTDGFLAHELQEVIPTAAHGTKDQVDADGKPVYQGIDQSKIVPLLTAALQEALNKIDALEARIVTLETKP